MDGFGSYLTIKKVFDIYQRLINKKNLDEFNSTYPIIRYNVENKDDDEKIFWKSILKCHQNHGLIFAPANRHSKLDDLDIFSEDYLVSKELTEDIRNYAQHSNVSINAVLQGA
jgi:hypothetical protein